MITTVSAGTPWAALTIPNHAEYCERQGYDFILRHLPYDKAVRDFRFISRMLEAYEMIWCLDADAVVTDMGSSFTTDSSGLHVCAEGLHDACPINCGSVIWYGQSFSRRLLRLLDDAEPEWKGMTWIWQQWIAERLKAKYPHDPFCEFVHVHPPRTFNSCHHGDKCLWEPGDFVYHPCGMPHGERMANIERVLGQVQR